MYGAPCDCEIVSVSLSGVSEGEREREENGAPRRTARCAEGLFCTAVPMTHGTCPLTSSRASPAVAPTSLASRDLKSRDPAVTDALRTRVVHTIWIVDIPNELNHKNRHKECENHRAASGAHGIRMRSMSDNLTISRSSGDASCALTRASFISTETGLPSW